MDYDFIEIGTSDFDTIIQSAPNNAVGLCIEPLKEYLDRLPEKQNVKKINCAVSFDNTAKEVTMFFIPSSVLTENNLPAGLKGCNSIGNYHPQHVLRNLTHLVQTAVVLQQPIADILIQNNVRGIDHLKLDTEGGDCFILKNLLLYLKDKETAYYPKKITFETNKLTPIDLIKETIKLFKDVGYTVAETNDFISDGNTVLIFK